MNDSVPKLPGTLRDRMVEIQARGTRLAIGLAPSLARMPYPLQRYDDSFLPYSCAVIDATSDLAAAYVFDLAAYLSVGASGAIALERSIGAVPGTCMTVLHGPFVRSDYAEMLGSMAFNVEAATASINFTTDPEALDRYLTQVRGVFSWAIRLPRPDRVDQFGLTLLAQGARDSVPLLPDWWLCLVGVDAQPPISWGWYSDSVAQAGRGADFAEAIRQAAVDRHRWLADANHHPWDRAL